MVEISVDAGNALARLMAAPDNIGKALVRGAVRVGLGMLRHLKEEELSGQALKVRTGTSRRAAFYRVDAGSDQDIVVVVGTDLSKAPHMRAQEKGAVLKPTQSQNLAIPIGEARTAKGVGKFSARELIADPQGFGYVGTFTHNRIIFGKKANGNVVPLFVLRPTVRLKAVGYLAHTASEKREWALGEMSKAAGEGLL